MYVDNEVMLRGGTWLTGVTVDNSATRGAVPIYTA